MKVLAVVCNHKSAALYSYQYLIASSVLVNVREKVIQNNGENKDSQSKNQARGCLWSSFTPTLEVPHCLVCAKNIRRSAQFDEQAVLGSRWHRFCAFGFLRKNPH